tara:strand:+ start:1621 stop:3669 length:2049 start_codon:yes stop_codon:yes gene_type:complete
MPYSDKDYKVSNVNYLNKDFSAFKNTLIEYAKTYFPNSYRDFNETSPGMMLIEMSAYVGDVLSFYIDQQYKEMMLPLAEERRNVINMANMLGFKVSPINPAYVDLTFTQTVTANSDDINNIVPNLSEAFAIDKAAKISSTVDSSIIFETLDIVDFTISGSADSEPQQNTFDSNGVVETYKLTRKVRAVSGETKTKTFTVSSPQKFLKLTLPETNVVEIISCTDSSDNRWYEVDFLAQDNVRIETHYTNDDDRTTAYGFFDDSGISSVPIPYSLQYEKSSKRFITEVNEDDTTSLVFGNGVLRSGQIQESAFIQLDQVGITIPGEESAIDEFVDPLDFSNNTNTLGEAPAHTTLTITYRIGGGISSNVPSGDLTTIDSSTDVVGTSAGKNLTVTNDQPARGGSAGLSIEEIRRGAKAFFATQNRCVTQEDYEARILSMPAKFGNIAKVFVDRVSVDDVFEEADIDSDSLLTLEEFQSIYGQGTGATVPTIDIYTLSYDNNKNLVTLPSNGDVAHPIKINLRNYLSQFRIISDEINIKDGYVVNFGVVFDIVSHKSENKADVKLRCINEIINYFNIDKMQFRQPIYSSDLEYLLMGLDGVRSVNFVKLTQGTESQFVDLFPAPLYYFDKDGAVVGSDSQYGYQYDFSQFYGDAAISSDGIILPSITPSVFELKNPRENVKGVVR